MYWSDVTTSPHRCLISFPDYNQNIKKQMVDISQKNAQKQGGTYWKKGKKAISNGTDVIKNQVAMWFVYCHLKETSTNEGGHLSDSQELFLMRFFGCFFFVRAHELWIPMGSVGHELCGVSFLYLRPPFERPGGIPGRGKKTRNINLQPPKGEKIVNFSTEYILPTQC